MPFVAQCPFCGHQMQCPDRALGASGRCPKCADFFTVVPLATSRSVPALQAVARPAPNAPQPVSPAPPEGPPRPEAEPSTTAPVAEVPIIDFTMLPQERVQPSTEAPQPTPRPVALAGLAGVFIALAGLFCASFPVLCVAVMPLALLGMAAGLLAICLGVLSGRGRLLLPSCGVAAGAALLVTALLFPGVLGPYYSAFRGRVRHDPNAIVAVPLQGKPRPAAGERSDWVDATQAALQQGSFRVEVVRAWVGPAEKSEQEERLYIRLRVQQVQDPGEFAHNRRTPPRYRDAEQRAKLTDAAGQAHEELPGPDRADAVAALSRSLVVYVEERLVFPAAAAGAAPLRLEIPAAGWGRKGSFRLTIPPEMIQRTAGR